LITLFPNYQPTILDPFLRSIAMATVSTINIEASSLNDLFNQVTIGPEALQKASQLLQEIMTFTMFSSIPLVST
jgi:hypothetical protein